MNNDIKQQLITELQTDLIPYKRKLESNQNMVEFWKSKIATTEKFLAALRDEELPLDSITKKVEAYEKDLRDSYGKTSQPD